MKIKDTNIETSFRGLRKDNPFRVPENYFETFSERLNTKIGEEQRVHVKRSMYITFKPFLAMAASFALLIVLIYIPYRKYYRAESNHFAQNKAVNERIDSAGGFPQALISSFSDEQFMSAFSDIDKSESKSLTSENLADFIAANYNDYEIVANN